MKELKDLTGKLITVISKSGQTYEGSVRSISTNNIELMSPSGKLVNILLKEIESYTYILSEETSKIVGERSIKDKEPQHELGNIKSLVELKRMKANEELKDIRKKLTSKNAGNQGTEYASTISTVRAIKKYPGE